MRLSLIKNRNRKSGKYKTLYLQVWGTKRDEGKRQKCDKMQKLVMGFQ